MLELRSNDDPNAVAEVNASTGAAEGAIVNSAGEPYDPAPEQESEILVIDIQRYEAAAVSVSTFYSYNGALNSDGFTIGDLTVPAGFAKLRARINPTEEYVSPSTGASTFYRSVQYIIRCNPFGWKLSALDRGSYYLDSD